MPEKDTNKPATIKVVLTLDSSLSIPVAEAVQQVTTALNEVVWSLGIPGKVELDLQYQALLESVREQLLTLTVSGRICRYPTVLLEQVRSYLCDRLPEGEISHADTAAWLKTETGSIIIPEFLAMTCAEIVKLQPACLLDKVTCHAYRASLLAADGIAETGMEIPDTTWLQPVLQRLLELRLPLSSLTEIARAVSTFRTRIAEDIIEELIAVLSSRVIELHLPLAYLQWLTNSNEQRAPEQLGSIRTTMRDESGLIYPALKFVIDEALRPNSFAIKINALLVLPQIGLKAGEYLVDETPNRLEQLNINAQPVLNPATLLPGSVAPQPDDPAVLINAGLTMRNAAGYMALSCIASLREYAGCFVRRDVVENLLSPQAYWNQTLTVAMRNLLSIEACTRILRDLVAEGINLRYWRLILEAIIDGCMDKERVSQHEQLLQFVRHRLQRVLSHKYACGTDTLVAYLLDTDIETCLAQRVDITDETSSLVDEDEQIIAAVQAELKHLPPTVKLPVVLTTDTVRTKLAVLLKLVFPRLSVIAHDDLIPNLNVQSLARIGLSLRWFLAGSR